LFQNSAFRNKLYREIFTTEEMVMKNHTGGSLKTQPGLFGFFMILYDKRFTPRLPNDTPIRSVPGYMGRGAAV
jgi:hypothetical protein